MRFLDGGRGPMSGSGGAAWSGGGINMRTAMILSAGFVSLGLAVSCIEDEDGMEGAATDTAEDDLAAAPDEELQGMEVERIGGVGTVAPGTEDARILLACPAGFFCLWAEPAKEGSLFGSSERGCRNLGGDPFFFSNVASSWRNRTSRNFRVYDGANCTGPHFTARSGAHADRMGGWNNRASSICSGSGCP
jgi:hypothetical protein